MQSNSCLHLRAAFAVWECSAHFSYQPCVVYPVEQVWKEEWSDKCVIWRGRQLRPREMRLRQESRRRRRWNPEEWNFPCRNRNPVSPVLSGGSVVYAGRDENERKMSEFVSAFRRKFMTLCLDVSDPRSRLPIVLLPHFQPGRKSIEATPWTWLEYLASPTDSGQITAVVLTEAVKIRVAMLDIRFWVECYKLYQRPSLSKIELGYLFFFVV